MQVKVEHVGEVFGELDELIHDYYDNTVAEKGMPPLCMNWPVYATLDKQCKLVLFTAREDKELVGFVMYHIHAHLHHMGTMCAGCDVLAVDPKYRGKGVARALMENVEPLLRVLGVDLILHMFRTCYDTEPLFPKLGYKLIEHSYLKELK